MGIQRKSQKEKGWKLSLRHSWISQSGSIKLTVDTRGITNNDLGGMWGSMVRGFDPHEVEGITVLTQ